MAEKKPKKTTVQKQTVNKKRALGDTKKPIKSKKKVNIKKRNEEKRENLIALFLVVFGIVFLFSVLTNSLGPFGRMFKAILLGQFSWIAVPGALSMVIIGMLKLLYKEGLDYDAISAAMIFLLFVALMSFYGAVRFDVISEMNLSFENIKTVFVRSAAGDGIGLWPYLITAMSASLIGRVGVFILSVSVILFVLIYYFKISFHRVGEFIKATYELIGQRINSFRAERNARKEETRSAVMESMSADRKFSPQEKKEHTFDFLNQYKMEIAEFTEFGISNGSQNAADDMDESPAFLNEQEDFSDREEVLFRESDRKNESNNASTTKTTDFPGDTIRFEGLRSLRTDNDEESISNNSARKETDEVKAGGSVLPEIVDVRLLHLNDRQEKENVQKLVVAESGSDLPKIPERPIIKKAYILPKVGLLKNYRVKQKETLQQQRDSQKLESVLKIYGIEAKVVNIAVGPTITRYELQLKMGIKVSRILNLSDDLALALAAVAPIRIEAPIPGTSLIGIELPNAETDIVSFRAMIESDGFVNSKGRLPVVLGKDVSGKPIIADISKMPHLLVAGSTGSGKSVCINTLICSILYKAAPDDVKLIMIDPKMVELSVYNNIPHLLIPVVTDMKKAPYALSWAVNEMNKRYKLFAENRVRDLDGYNSLPGIEKLPRIMIIVDELADLMMVSPNEVEDCIIRLAQKARACGMHLVIATQRPSVDVITGLIKANIPTRIAFAVSSQIDSRTILDQAGAEKLIGKGDLLFSHPSIAKPQRIQGALISDEEVNAVVDFINSQQIVSEEEPVDILEQQIREAVQKNSESEQDPMLEEIKAFAMENRQISTSLIQRRFRIGYNRAARLIDELESMGIVSESDGAKPRRVLVGKYAEDVEEN